MSLNAHYLDYNLSKRKEEFQKNLTGEFFNIFSYDIPKALTIIIKKIHADVIKNPDWDDIGSTLVICHINKLTNEIITAVSRVYKNYLLILKIKFIIMFNIIFQKANKG